eukprot:CAMPEP_0173378392 /NCGR_PEP_ID=MMETSP1356-20130122/1553_1 /TAXON_ID=77927 ORGANISM="Hemiselmis virescens, Strain PCC157" /NCGR_SAMPLE_ID=MMETSP1356 /ASSEMBLY_ACC=CAM_ASM_000847 /LENGTH=73 /DNA_ID=CAMNT_0014331435 /DNA_START=187 /DNA_END=405 /DNA_ORIENTATION=+
MIGRSAAKAVRAFATSTAAKSGGSGAKFINYVILAGIGAAGVGVGYQMSVYNKNGDTDKKPLGSQDEITSYMW